MSKPQAQPIRQSKTAHKTDNFKAILWILLSVAASSTMAVAVRDVSAQLDSRMIVFGRGALSTGLLLLAILLYTRLRRHLRFSKPWQHLTRGTAIAFSTHLGFYAISQLPMATVTVLFFTAPIWATILAIVVHKEQIGPRRVAAIALGFIGAMIILRPGIDVLHPAMLAALGSSVLFALALTMSRGLAQADGAFSAYFSSVVITALVSLPFAWQVMEAPHDGRGWIAAGAVVAGGMIRGFADIEAYRHGEAGILAPITYLRLVLITIAAYFLYAETPDTPTLIGAAVIIGATLYIAQRETSAKRRAARLQSGGL